MKKSIYTLLVCAIVCNLSAQKWENLANTPQMGWNSWNKFACNIDENIIREMADSMVSSGLRDAGYIYLNIDDCWHGTRDAQGFITADSVKFPSGIKAIAEYVHSKGLKLGIYSDAGTETCGGRPGSLGHEYQDALTYAQWDVDYLKYDWCNTENINPIGAYTLMRDALRKAGRPILFSMCEWGNSQPWNWAAEVGHSWRTTGDIACAFDKDVQHNTWTQLCVLSIVDKNEPLRKYAAPGHWNDPDMLEVGNGMSTNQDRAHFTLWCMMAAPLILGNDLRNMSEATKSILLNREAIAINQDALGVQGLRYKTENDIEFWLKPLQNGDWAFCIFNRSTEPRTYHLVWKDFEMRDEVSGKATELATHPYTIKNIWTGKTEGKTDQNKKLSIPAQDVIFYRLAQ